MKQQTNEWLELRKKYIGASDAPIIMGVSPYKRSDGRKKTPYILWMEKLDLLPRDAETPAMRFGKENESIARAEYEKKIGDYVTPKVCFHKEIPYLLASLDGISLDGKLAVEIKSANYEDHTLAKTKKVPAKYYPQVQQQMACTGLDHIHYFSFHKGEGVIVEVERDDKYLEEMYEKEKGFWECLKNFKAPELTSDDFHQRDSRWYTNAKRLLDLKEKMKELKEEEKTLEHFLRELSCNENSYFKDLRYASSRRKGNVDYSKIPELKGVDLEAFRKPSAEVWRLARI